MYIYIYTQWVASIISSCTCNLQRSDTSRLSLRKNAQDLEAERGAEKKRRDMAVKAGQKKTAMHCWSGGLPFGEYINVNVNEFMIY